MRRIQAKKHELGTYEIDKISLSCFDDKRYVLDDGIYTLAYFHKDSVTSCKEIKKDFDNWKRLWWLKKIVIIEKDWDKWKRLQNDFSSNINEGIRAVLFFYEKISHTQKAQNANKRLSLRCFYGHTKHAKHKKYIKHKTSNKQFSSS